MSAAVRALVVVAALVAVGTALVYGQLRDAGEQPHLGVRRRQSPRPLQVRGAAVAVRQPLRVGGEAHLRLGQQRAQVARPQEVAQRRQHVAVRQAPLGLLDQRLAGQAARQPAGRGDEGRVDQFVSGSDGTDFPSTVPSARDITPWGTTSDTGCYIGGVTTDPSAAGVVYESGSQNLWQSQNGGSTWRNIGG